MYCNYVLCPRNNCLKASHNPTISCRRFGFRRFSLSPLWPCLLSRFRHVAVLTVNHQFDMTFVFRSLKESCYGSYLTLTSILCTGILQWIGGLQCWWTIYNEPSTSYRNLESFASITSELTRQVRVLLRGQNYGIVRILCPSCYKIELA